MDSLNSRLEDSGNNRRNRQLIFLLRISMCSEINRGVKRRDLEDVYHEFPHFCLLPRKSRRLDCQFTSGNDVGAVNHEVERRLQLDQSAVSCAADPNDDACIMDVTHSYETSADHALVLFQPADLLRSPCAPKLEIKVHPDLVDDLRNYRYQITSAYTQEVKDQTPSIASAAADLAVITWTDPNGQATTSLQPMESDSDSEMMEMDGCTEPTNATEGLQHPSQLCSLPHACPNTASPVRWW